MQIRRVTTSEAPVGVITQIDENIRPFDRRNGDRRLGYLGLRQGSGAAG